MSLTQINKAGLDEIALDHVFTIGASGSSAYTFQGEGLNGTVNNPTLYLTRGKTYRFENGSGGHPIRIQSTSGASGTAYNTGVTNNAGSGTVIVEVQHDAPDVLYYQCTSHAAMNGILYITGALADGSVTTAKIANGAVTTAKIADDAVTVDKIQNFGQNQIAGRILSGTGNLQGLSAQNVRSIINVADGANQTTINNNADNRVITGSSSANTLNAESSMIIDSSGNVCVGGNPEGFEFQVTDASGAAVIRAKDGANNKIVDLIANSTGGLVRTIGAYPLVFNTNQTERMRIDASGNVGIGTSSPSYRLDILEAAGNGLRIKAGDTTADISLSVGSAGTADKFVIQSGGNVGIGTSSPQTKLDVTGTSVIGRFKSTNNNYVLALQGNNASQQSFIGTTSSGDMVFATGSGVSERIRLREGGGLTFNGDTAADNALDDYEEGTWTGLLNGGNFTATQTNFVYTKIGRQVTVNGTLTAFSSSSNSSNIELTGLPFSTASGISFAGPAFFSKVNKYNNYGYPQACRVEEGSNRIIFMYNGEGANGQFPVRYGDLNNTSDSRIQFTATYFTT